MEVEVAIISRITEKAPNMALQHFKVIWNSVYFPNSVAALAAAELNVESVEKVKQKLKNHCKMLIYLLNASSEPASNPLPEEE